LSRLTGSVIVPVTNTARPRKLFRSWDRFELPSFGARLIIGYGEPLLVPKHADAERRGELKRLLENRLNDLTTELDKRIGYVGAEVWPHADH
jgi:lysophospholipid acyltransferase (LPLAT)-like uncharacterized protein